MPSLLGRLAHVGRVFAPTALSRWVGSPAWGGSLHLRPFQSYHSSDSFLPIRFFSQVLCSLCPPCSGGVSRISGLWCSLIPVCRGFVASPLTFPCIQILAGCCNRKSVTSSCFNSPLYFDRDLRHDVRDRNEILVTVHKFAGTGAGEGGKGGETRRFADPPPSPAGTLPPLSFFCLFRSTLSSAFNPPRFSSFLSF